MLSNFCQQYICYHCIHKWAWSVSSQATCSLWWLVWGSLELLLTKIFLSKRLLLCVTVRVARCPVFYRTVRFFGHLSSQKYDAKPDNQLSGFSRPWKFVNLSARILSKIVKIVATRWQIFTLKCTKFDFGWGSAPDPAGGAYSAPPDPLAGFKRAYI